MRILLTTAATFAMVGGFHGAAMAQTTSSNTADSVTTTDHLEGANYFDLESSLPFKAPDFSKISEDDYLPAFKTAMAIQKGEIQRIIDNPEPPTFENTIVALEKSGRMLGRVSAVFFHLTGADTTDRLDEINTEISPKLSAHSDSIVLNPELFARVKAVYDNRAAMSMTPEDAKLLEDTYQGMVHAGAELTDAQRERVKEINTELSTVTTEFAQDARNAMADQPVFFDSREELAGLSEADITAAADLAKEEGQPGKFAIALQNTTQQPLLPSMENRAAREKLFMASYHRADGTTDIDTRPLVAKIAELRAEKAALFGQPDWASYTMYDRMVDSPQAALEFMGQMVPALAETQRREGEMLTEKIAEEGGDYEVKPWDWYRYSNMIKAERYQVDDDEVMKYFQLDKVLEDGVFYAANKLYGLTFERRTDLPVYNDDVWVYTVKDADGSDMGLFYFDPFQRASKRGGAWMSNFVDQSFLWNEKPVIYNVLNIPKAPKGEPQLVSFDWVETAFHEFGHALHGFGHRDRARFRGVPEPGQRDVGDLSRSAAELRQELQDGRDYPDRAGRQDPRIVQVQPGLRLRRSAGSGVARYEVARPFQGRSRCNRHPGEGLGLRDQIAQGPGAGDRTGTAALPDDLLQPHLLRTDGLFLRLLQLSVDSDARP